MPSYPEPNKPRSPTALEDRRQAALDRLTEAFAEDRLPLEAYEERVARAQNADSVEELDSLMSDLPAPRPAAQTARRGTAAFPNAIDGRISGGASVACVMGDRHMTGDWLTGDRVESFTLMGSTKLDLRESALPPGRLKIDVFCLMGETKIIVPRGLPVRLNAFPFMGEAHAARDVARRIEPGSPYVDISGFAMMGSLVVVAMD